MNLSKVKDHDLIYVFFHLYYHSFHQHIRMSGLFQFNYRQKKYETKACNQNHHFAFSLFWAYFQDHHPKKLRWSCFMALNE